VSRLDESTTGSRNDPDVVPAPEPPPHASGGSSLEPPVHPPASSTHRDPRRRRRLLLRMLAICGGLGIILAGSGVGLALMLQHRYDKNIERFGDPFTGLPAKSRPSVGATGAMNILLLGSDSRISAGDPTSWVRGAQRTDAIMIAHVPADRKHVTITSIPRDSWVDVPGHGDNKINAGFSFGGPTLMVKTVEELTGVRIDHVVIADFEGFTRITDELGGVQITVPKATHDEASSFQAGPQLMDGATALKYVRQRHNLPGGDFDRVKRQQNWIRAVAVKALDKGTLTSPFKLNSVLDSLTSALAADDEFSFGTMRSLALSLRNVRGDDLTFMTAPVAGTGRSPDGQQSIVLLDKKADKALWKALKSDRMDAWLTAHPKAALGTSVR
jgi:LCP family protein required for cell wall assembly